MFEGIALSWTSLALLFGIGQVLIVAPALYMVKSPNRLSKHLFVLTLVAFSLNFLELLVYQSEALFKLAPNLIIALHPFAFIAPVLLYFFVRAQLNDQFKFKKRYLWNAAPILLLSAPTFIFLTMNTDEKISLYQSYQGYDAGAEFVDYIVLIHFLCYLIPAIYASVSHNKGLKSQYSFLEQVNVRWLTLVLCLLTFMSVLHVLSLGSNMVSDNQFILSMVATIYLLGFLALRHTLNMSKIELASDAAASNVSPLTKALHDQIIVTNSDTSTVLSDNPKDRKRYSTEIDEELRQTIYQSLEQGMKQEQWFLDSYLTLKKLASHIDTHPNYVSRTINESFNVTFFEYINRHRIDYVKTLLAEDPDRNTLTIAMDAGFNSKSSFYTAFKKHVGCNPREFKQRLEAEH